jgi:cytidine deaminase
MLPKTIEVNYFQYESCNELATADAKLLATAKEATKMAYAPYSNFKVGAAAMLNNGSVSIGFNQENAAYPVCLCAEGVLLANCSTNHHNIIINAIAISYQHLNQISKTPITPCGVCRQSLAEYEKRQNSPIKLILSGLAGKVYVLQSASALLPLSFSGDDLQ